MNIQFENRIEIIPKEDVDSITEEGIVPKEGKTTDRLLTENDLKLTDSPEELNGNSFYRQNLNVIISKLPGMLAQKYRNRRPVIVQLHQSDGALVVWGDPNSPVRVTGTPYPGHDMLELTRNSVNPVL